MRILPNNKRLHGKILKLGILIVCTTVLMLTIIRLTHYHRDVPKPYGHPYIQLPSHTYMPLGGRFPYSFDISTHAVVQPNTSSMAEPYWIDIHYPGFQADILITYKCLKNDKKLLSTYLEDSYKLSMKHQIRASAIDSDVIQTPNGLTITLVTLKGQVPTPFQFYTTNPGHHFLRGVVYFSTSLENDYLAPIIDFIKLDIIHMLDTLQWTDPAQK